MPARQYIYVDAGLSQFVDDRILFAAQCGYQFIARLGVQAGYTSRKIISRSTRHVRGVLRGNYFVERDVSYAADVGHAMCIWCIKTAAKILLFDENQSPYHRVITEISGKECCFL